MTDNSNAAPERIWALPDLTQEWAKDGGLGDRPYDHLIDGYTEYIRADLASAQIAVAYKAAAKVAQDHRATYHGRSPLNSISAAADQRMATAAGAIYVEICTLTPADANDALDALLKAERAKAYERAAVEISDYQAFTKYAQEPLTNEMCAAIRALAQEDE